MAHLIPCGILIASPLIRILRGIILPVMRSVPISSALIATLAIGGAGHRGRDRRSGRAPSSSTPGSLTLIQGGTITTRWNVVTAGGGVIDLTIQQADLSKGIAVFDLRDRSVDHLPIVFRVIMYHREILVAVPIDFISVALGMVDGRSPYPPGGGVYEAVSVVGKRAPRPIAA
jgi:hypothetical protein